MKHNIAVANVLSIVVLATASMMAMADSPTSHQQARPSTETTAPDQSVVAAKTTFKTVPAAAIAQPKAISATDLASAVKMVGTKAAFHGTVTFVYSPAGHEVAILDFAENYRTAMTAVVKSTNYAKFPPLSGLNGKQVLITGKFTVYHGHPEVELSDPGQVALVK